MQRNAHSDALSNGVGQQGHTVPSVAKNAHSDALLNKVGQRGHECFLQKKPIVTPFQQTRPTRTCIFVLQKMHIVRHFSIR